MVEQLAAETGNGEGFAFFRWHALRYPEAPNCDGDAICNLHWMAYRRGA